MKCPKCNAEIDYLKHYQSGEDLCYFTGDDYEPANFQPDGKTNDYECPKCSVTLFKDEKEAEKFLNGE